MFKGKITGSATADTNLIITPIKNTNNNITYNTNTNVIQFNTPGWYDIVITLVCTGSASGFTLTEIVNGVTSTTAVAIQSTSATSDVVTLNIADAIQVIPATIGEKATVAFQLNTDATISSALILVEGRK